MSLVSLIPKIKLALDTVSFGHDELGESNAYKLPGRLSPD